MNRAASFSSFRLAFRLAVALSFALGSAIPARADDAPAARAQVLFEEGVRLLERGDYVGACRQFAESQRLAPAGGTALDLGYCNEMSGRLASALSAYEDALRRAKEAGRGDRAQTAALKVEELGRRVPRLRVQLAPSVAALTDVQLEIDGEAVPVAAGARPVDAGDHQVIVRAKGWEPLTRATAVQGEGTTVEVVIDALVPEPSPRAADALSPSPSSSAVAPVAAPPDLATHPVPPPARSTSARTGVTVALGATGIVLLGVGVATGVLALDSHAESNRLCPTPTTCLAGGAEAEDRARTYGWVSTGGIGLGVVLAGAATYLWLTTPRQTLRGASAATPLVWRF
jgi:hypothetical protein